MLRSIAIIGMRNSGLWLRWLRLLTIRTVQGAGEALPVSEITGGVYAVLQALSMSIIVIMDLSAMSNLLL